MTLSLGVGALLGGETFPADGLRSCTGAHGFFCCNTQGTAFFEESAGDFSFAGFFGLVFFCLTAAAFALGGNSSLVPFVFFSNASPPAAHWPVRIDATIPSSFFLGGASEEMSFFSISPSNTWASRLSSRFPLVDAMPKSRPACSPWFNSALFSEGSVAFAFSGFFLAGVESPRDGEPDHFSTDQYAGTSALLEASAFPSTAGAVASRACCLPMDARLDRGDFVLSHVSSSGWVGPRQPL
ncbi:hypothetical protein EYF80_016991 [Liparis tanakae]|uniref:Uncharacterized protein n=1 Tax=Liparis tanakae TaxID=230148 RepID=A0A4Z2I3Z7_9TELE|nr:hypothetical protein EYF80_016991 [Liparis tanakae]